MQTFIVGFWLLCIGGVASAISGLLGSSVVGWFSLAFGLVGVGNIFVGLAKLFAGIE